MPLHDFAKAWEDAPVATNPQNSDLPPLPDGSYNCRLARAEVGKSKKTGADMVTLGFEVVAGEWKNRWIWKRSTLTTDARRLGFLKRDLSFIGVDVKGPIESLDEQLRDCLGIELVIDLRTKTGSDNVERQNTYLNAPQGWAEPAADDEIPF